MVRPLAALWLSLLVALLGGPSAARAPRAAWGDSPAVQHTPERAPDAFVRAMPGWHVALDARPRKDHPPAVQDGLPWAGPATPASPTPPIGRSRDQLARWTPAPAGRSPILTTGPPSHA